MYVSEILGATMVAPVAPAVTSLKLYVKNKTENPFSLLLTEKLNTYFIFESPSKSMPNQVKSNQVIH